MKNCTNLSALPALASKQVASYGIMWLCLLLTVGCGAGRFESSNAGSAIFGKMVAAEQPIRRASVQLYAMGTGETPGQASSVPLLTQPVQTDDDGNFSISSRYTCPSSDAQLYLLGTGGYAGASTTQNPSIALIASLGSCSGMAARTSAQLNELTTIGAIWPLSPYMQSATRIAVPSLSGSNAQASLLTVTKLVDVESGTAPGPALTSDETVSVDKIYTLASILDNCIFSSGGTAGDGSPCGNLFATTTTAAVTPRDTVAAALVIAQSPSSNVSSLFALIQALSIFKPILSLPPNDWTLVVSTAPALPSISPGSGTYFANQVFSITESVTGAVIHYTLDGSTPNAASPIYTGPFTLTKSSTVKAVAILGTLISPVSSVNVGVTSPIQVTTTPSVAFLTPAQSLAVQASVQNAANTAVTWSMSPSVGFLTPMGLYTAPTSITHTQQVVVTATSVADSSKTSSVVIGLIASLAPTVTYYVDAVAGNDNNNGRTSSAAFASIAKVNSLALDAGQTVAFRAGQEWHDILNIQRSGTPSLPITFTSFGTGVAPVISAADLTSHWTLTGANRWQIPSSANPGIPVFSGQAGIPVISLSAVTASRNFFWSGTTLTVYSTVNPSTTVEVPQRAYAAYASGASYVTLANLELRGATNNDMYVTCSTSACTGWTFTGDIFNSSFSNALYVVVPDAIKGGLLSVTASIFEGGGSSGVKFSGGVMGNIVGNQFSNLCGIYNPNTNNLENTFCDAIYGFSANGLSQAGTYVAENTIQNIGTTQSSVPYGGGIHADTVTGWNIEQNAISNTKASGLNLEKGQGSIARYNTLMVAGYGLYQAGIVVRAGDATTSYQASGNSIAQTVEFNTVAAGSYWGCNLQVSQNSGLVVMSQLVFQKNICAQGTSAQALYADAGANASTNLLLDNNFGTANRWFIAFAGSFPGSYSAFDSAWGSSTASVQGDPQLVSPSTGNFALLSTSPAVGIGALP